MRLYEGHPGGVFPAARRLRWRHAPFGGLERDGSPVIELTKDLSTNGRLHAARSRAGVSPGPHHNLTLCFRDFAQGPGGGGGLRRRGVFEERRDEYCKSSEPLQLGKN